MTAEDGATNSEEEETADNALLTFGLPSNYLPGMDLPSKRVLKAQTTIDMIMRSLLDVSNGTYCSSGTEWNNGMRCDVLYTPRLSIHTSLPPVLIEVQRKINDAFIRRIIQYCLSVTNIYPNHPLPIVLIFCVDKASARNLSTKFESCDEKPWLKQFPCTGWATNCYLVSNDAPDDDRILDPLHAVSLFFSEQQPALHSHSHAHDSTIKSLYKLIMTLCEEDETYKDNFLKTINDVCDTHETLYHRIYDAIKDIPGTRKACKIVERARQYNTKVKRKFSMVETDSDSSLELPAKLPMVSKATEASATPEQEIAFIRHYRKNLIGKMNWNDCLTRGHAEGLFKRYSTGNSLRANFGSRIKNQ
ncbi:hypothetical protein O0I10_000607 [Lichtheimia ornata]|uniref:Uncharacterized protein n=1 Tax=Lichtheimia ornata TaxID=688661 RepID=A0AAD7Y3Z2_9FUNG|nr:uncharacterized protein O0I10_000607 [Lichtheimia ornata]KAJ8663368.1 hypothetical protein O0I10_000607 [Lichtheimia ornata]